MTEPVDPALLALQQEYVASLPLRIQELKADLESWSQGSTEAAGSLRSRLHRLAGSGGSYGFAEISAIAREAERWLGANPATREPAELMPLLERLTLAARAAKEGLAAAASGDGVQVVPRVLIIMRPSPQRDRIGQELTAAGYQVRFGTRTDAPSSVPDDHFPHLLVIGGEAGDGDLSAIASTWTNTPERRPGAVVLVETLRPVDRLRAIAAGVDAVFPAEQVEQKLPRYARTFARIGPPPSSVVLLDHDAARAAQLSEALALAHVRVVCSPRADAVVETLNRENPDLLILSSQPVDSDPFALARVVRQDPRYHLLPIIFVGHEDTNQRLASLRAGADDFVAIGADARLLVQTVVARAARGRRIRELVHRDGLTGLLNHATLISELENAVEFSQRYGEPLAFVVFELEEFRRITERLGPRVGDEVLLHASAVFRSNVRASDVIGRYGWEAFGMLLRGANAAGAGVLAQNLRRALGEQPAQTSGGERIPLRVRVGTAVFPRDGTTAAELAQVAGQRVGGETGKPLAGDPP